MFPFEPLNEWRKFPLNVDADTYRSDSSAADEASDNLEEAEAKRSSERSRSSSNNWIRRFKAATSDSAWKVSVNRSEWNKQRQLQFDSTCELIFREILRDPLRKFACGTFKESDFHSNTEYSDDKCRNCVYFYCPLNETLLNVDRAKLCLYWKEFPQARSFPTHQSSIHRQMCWIIIMMSISGL